MRILIGVLIGCVLISVCGGCQNVSGKDEARKVAEAFFEDRKASGGIGSTSYYSPLFWDGMDDRQWARLKAIVREVHGNLQDYSLSNWFPLSKLGVNAPSGEYVLLIYDTSYEKGTGEERLTFFKADGDATYRIVGHQFGSLEIQKRLEESGERPKTPGRTG